MHVRVCLQVGLDRETRDRVLVLRFIMTLPMPSLGCTAAGEPP